MKPAMTNPKSPGRRRRIIGWTAIPERREPSERPEKAEE